MRFRRVVERLPAIVYLEAADPNGDLPGSMLYVSPQVREILGFAPEEWVNDPTAWVQHFHPDDRARVRQIYDAVSRRPGHVHGAVPDVHARKARSAGSTTRRC